jgi:hypothetical protein
MCIGRGGGGGERERASLSRDEDKLKVTVHYLMSFSVRSFWEKKKKTCSEQKRTRGARAIDDGESFKE